MNEVRRNSASKALGELSLLSLAHNANRNAAPATSTYRPVSTVAVARPSLDNLNVAISSARLDRVADAVQDLQDLVEETLEAAEDTTLSVVEEYDDEVAIRIGNKTIRLSVDN